MEEFFSPKHQSRTSAFQEFGRMVCGDRRGSLWVRDRRDQRPNNAQPRCAATAMTAQQLGLLEHATQEKSSTKWQVRDLVI